jgi:hypothetical protein
MINNSSFISYINEPSFYKSPSQEDMMDIDE